jgi:transcriptional regulator with XRE-family HTH domain
MAKRKQKPQTLAQALKQAIEDGPKSRYQISKESGVPEGTLSRFVNFDTDIRLSTIDALLPALGLGLPQKVDE